MGKIEKRKDKSVLREGAMETSGLGVTRAFQGKYRVVGFVSEKPWHERDALTVIFLFRTITSRISTNILFAVLFGNNHPKPSRFFL